MYREFGEKLKLISQSYVRVYAAGEFDRHWYPYKLRRVDKATSGQRAETMEMILDSAITKPDITNQDVLAKAEELNPQYVIPKDVMEDQVDGDVHLAVAESVAEFLDLWEQSETRARPLIPLQPPYPEHFDMIRDRIGYAPTHLCLGGMKDNTTSDQVAAAKELVEHVPNRPYIHLLGIGASLEFIRMVQLDPVVRKVVDSIDLATTEHMSKSKHAVAGRTWKHRKAKLANGKNRSTITAAFSDAHLLHLNFMLGPYCWDDLIQPVDEIDPGDLDDQEIDALEQCLENPLIPEEEPEEPEAPSEQEQVATELSQWYADG